jgi:hypothetical protein
MNDTELEKVRLLDHIFKSLTIDDLKLIFKEDLLISAIKGDDHLPGSILGAVQQLSMLQVEILLLRNEQQKLKDHVRDVIRVLSMLQPVPNCSYELQTLKTMFGII